MLRYICRNHRRKKLQSIHKFLRSSTIGEVATVRQWLSTATKSKLSEVMITCLPGLEQVLSTELRSLQIPHEIIRHGTKLIEPSIEETFRCYLYLGSASQILLQFGEAFSARGLAELRRKTSKLPWTDMFGSLNVRLEARVSTSKSKLYHSIAIQSRVIAGVYEALGHDDIRGDRERVEYPPLVSNEDPLVRLEVEIVKDQVKIWICAATTPMHRRGYRLETSKAPLREDLAYSMLYAAGWFPAWASKSQLLSRSYDLLLDPMCGSGTLAIEGSAMLMGLPPGRLRPQPLNGTKYQNRQLYQELLKKSTPETFLSTEEPRVLASDRDAGAVAATRSNAERAGVVRCIDIRRCAISSHPLWSSTDPSYVAAESHVLLATNPPFGKRVSKRSPSPQPVTGKRDFALLPMYQTLRHLVEIRPNTDAVLLCQGKDILHRAGWSVKERFNSMHGGLSVSVVGTHPESHGSCK